MYIIKQIPEDFIVAELTNLKTSSAGEYSVFLLKKRDLSTPEAVEILERNLGVKKIGYAGNKDRKAVTEQLISISGDYKNIVSKAKTPKMSLKFLGFSKNPISLGDLEGNHFEITLRNLEEKMLKKIFAKIKQHKKRIPNIFGEQRFSKNNDKIGKFIVSRQFDRACRLLVRNDRKFGAKIKEYLDMAPNDFIGALRLIPRNVLMIYVHSFQSRIFNETVSIISKFTQKNQDIPIVGFGTELKNTEIHKTISAILKNEKISQRDFIIRQFPELSSEGDKRVLYIAPENLKISPPENDELNENKKKLKLTFSLPKGSYATVVVESLLS